MKGVDKLEAHFGLSISLIGQERHLEALPEIQNAEKYLKVNDQGRIVQVSLKKAEILLSLGMLPEMGAEIIKMQGFESCQSEIYFLMGRLSQKKSSLFF